MGTNSPELSLRLKCAKFSGIFQKYAIYITISSIENIAINDWPPEWGAIKRKSKVNFPKNVIHVKKCTEMLSSIWRLFVWSVQRRRVTSAERDTKNNEFKSSAIIETNKWWHILVRLDQFFRRFFCSELHPRSRKTTPIASIFSLLAGIRIELLYFQWFSDIENEQSGRLPSAGCVNHVSANSLKSIEMHVIQHNFHKKSFIFVNLNWIYVKTSKMRCNYADESQQKRPFLHQCHVQREHFHHFFPVSGRKSNRMATILR